MDLVYEIRNKLEVLKSEKSYDSISAAIRHIEMAERHLKRGQNENDEECYNDVIYRTNQSFEGILKEVYTVLTGKKSTKMTTHQIERQLLKAKVLTKRVLDLFTNYRQNWRNPSTHDHRLLFHEQEAFLAIVNISAFVIILLDQIIETVNLEREREKVRKYKEPITKVIRDYRNLRFDMQMISLIAAFNYFTKNSTKAFKEITEIEILGRLQGFVSGSDTTIKIVREPTLSQDITFQPDLVLGKGDDKVIVELKRYWKIDRVLALAINQMKMYMESGNFRYGILYFFPLKSDQEDTIIKVELTFGNKPAYLYVILPKIENYMQIFGKIRHRHKEINMEELYRKNM